MPVIKELHTFAWFLCGCGVQKCLEACAIKACFKTRPDLRAHGRAHNMCVGDTCKVECGVHQSTHCFNDSYSFACLFLCLRMYAYICAARTWICVDLRIILFFTCLKVQMSFQLVLQSGMKLITAAHFFVPTPVFLRFVMK